MPAWDLHAYDLERLRAEKQRKRTEFATCPRCGGESWLVLVGDEPVPADYVCDHCRPRVRSK